jgi:N-acetylglucosaminyl-diphospho-decaprenol L-rhamnosyltransferase
MSEETQYAIGNAHHASLAIIVVSYNVRELLRACLQATFASLARAPGIDATVWVVDNASADCSAEMVAAEFPPVRLVASRENLGFAGGNNLVLRELGFGTEERGAGSGGAEEQRSPFGGADSSRITEYALRNTHHAPRPDLILLLNPDAEPSDDAIEQMTHFLLAHPEVGGVGAQLRYPDGRFQHGVFRFPGLFQLWFDLFPPRPRRLLDSRLNGRYPRTAYARGRPFPIDFALGAALMVRGAAIAAAGLLDEGFFMYAEEVDWCWRIRRAGWPFYCVPSAVVIHHGGASTRQFRSQSFVNLWRSRRRLYDRFYGPVRRWLAGGVVRLGMRAEVRRVRAAAGRGEITSAELAERVAAAREVTDMFVRLHG